VTRKKYGNNGICLTMKQLVSLFTVIQGRLHHINDGANVPWKK